MRLKVLVLLAAIVVGVFTGARGADAGVRVSAVADRPSRRNSHDPDLNDLSSLDYAAWIDLAIAKLGGDDEGAQSKTADLLALTVVDSSVQAKVLAALESHLNGDNREFRMRCVRAYGHWANLNSVSKLSEVVATPEEGPKVNGPEASWVAAVAAMVSLNSDAAKTSMERRAGDFFFRDHLTQTLITMTADNNPSQPAAFDLLKQLDPDNNAVKYSLADAEKMVRSDSAGERTKGANALVHAVVKSSDRATVLGLLKSHLAASNGSARLPFVQAFAHWASASEVPALQEIMAGASSSDKHNNDEDSWVAATVGLVRLDPKAALEEAKTHATGGFYVFKLHGALDPVAQGNGANSSVAAWLLGQVDPHQKVPAPAHFSPGPAKTTPVARQAA